MSQFTSWKKWIQGEDSYRKTYAILSIGALFSVWIHFFPLLEAAYVVAPWIYLPCFLCTSRWVERKWDFGIWMLFWCGSFLIRYWGILLPFSNSVSVLLTFLAACVYALPFWIDRLTYKRGPWAVSVLMFPLASTALDYIMELTRLGSLFSLAPTQFDNKPLLQISSIFGGKGIVFLLTLTAVLIVVNWKNRKKLAVCLGILLLIHAFGLIRMEYHAKKIEAADRITIGWSAAPVTDDSFFVEELDGSLEENAACLESTLLLAKKEGIELLCFPEESFYLDADAHDAFIERAQELAARYGINLLLSVESEFPDADVLESGVSESDLSESDVSESNISEADASESDSLNADDELGINHCLFINTSGKIASDYMKTMLIPVAEEPYYTEGKGELPKVHAEIDQKDLVLSYAICFDGDFASYVRTIPDETDLFIDVSWDWPQVDDLHYRIIGLRAVENGLSVIKPTINGFTTVTDYVGSVHSMTHSDDTGYNRVILVEPPLATCRTIYHAYGDKIDFSFLIGVVILLILSVFMRGNEMSSKKPLTRFGEFELLKAMAIIGLPLVHVMEEALEAGMASPALEAFGTSIIGLCAFGPSVFMICMGFGIGGGKTGAASTRKSGIQFLMIGAILNLLRWLLPGIIQKFAIGTKLIEDVKFCLQSDIYYFVGIFFIFYSFLKQWKMTSTQLLLISLISLTINNALTPIMQTYVTNEVVGSIVGNFIYVDDTSCFPLLSWMIFPTVGIILGEVLKKSTEEFREVFMRRMMDFCIVFLGAFVFFLWNYKIDVMKVLVSPANDYITDLPNVILLIALALFLVGIVYYLCKLIGHTKFMKFMLKISMFIIPFYLLQWIIIAWIFYATAIFRLPEGCFGIPAYIITVLATTLICIYVATEHGMKIMKRLMKITSFKKKKRKKGGK